MSHLFDLKIGAIVYRVEEVDQVEGGVAEIDQTQSVIKILKHMDIHQKQLSLIHEVFHAFNSELSEFKTEALAQSFYALLIENPDVFTFKYKEVS